MGKEPADADRRAPRAPRGYTARARYGSPSRPADRIAVVRTNEIHTQYTKSDNVEHLVLKLGEFWLTRCRLSRGRASLSSLAPTPTPRRPPSRQVPGQAGTLAEHGPARADRLQVLARADFKETCGRGFAKRSEEAFAKVSEERARPARATQHS